MNWLCQYVYNNGVGCTNLALFRLHFNKKHPFDHLDVCYKHLYEYSHYSGLQSLSDPKNVIHDIPEKVWQ